MQKTQQQAALYVVATPIGNLGDLSPRAVEVLQSAALILAEDTRTARKLASRFGIRTPLASCHDHSQKSALSRHLGQLRSGKSLALISEAGTPLLSDPGYPLVASAHAQGIPVRTVPGPSAVTAALSIAGIPCERFAFEGFLPARAPARRKRLAELRGEPRTLVFFEAPHRLSAALADLAAAFGTGREAALVREMTKLHETARRGTLQSLCEKVQSDPDQRRGECVLVVRGAEGGDPDYEAARRLVALLGAELPPSRAAALAAEFCGLPRRALYRLQKAR